MCGQASGEACGQGGGHTPEISFRCCSFGKRSLRSTGLSVSEGGGRGGGLLSPGCPCAGCQFQVNLRSLTETRPESHQRPENRAVGTKIRMENDTDIVSEISIVSRGEFLRRFFGSLRIYKMKAAYIVQTLILGRFRLVFSA